MRIERVHSTVQLKTVRGDSRTAYSALVAATRWILGSPSFHPIAKLVCESLMDNELNDNLCQKEARELFRVPSQICDIRLSGSDSRTSGDSQVVPNVIKYAPVACTTWVRWRWTYESKEMRTVKACHHE